MISSGKAVVKLAQPRHHGGRGGGSRIGWCVLDASCEKAEQAWRSKGTQGWLASSLSVSMRSPSIRSTFPKARLLKTWECRISCGIILNHSGSRFTITTAGVCSVLECRQWQWPGAGLTWMCW